MNGGDMILEFPENKGTEPGTSECRTCSPVLQAFSLVPQRRTMTSARSSIKNQRQGPGWWLKGYMQCQYAPGPESDSRQPMTSTSKCGTGAHEYHRVGAGRPQHCQDQMPNMQTYTTDQSITGDSWAPESSPHKRKRNFYLASSHFIFKELAKLKTQAHRSRRVSSKGK